MYSCISKAIIFGFGTLTGQIRMASILERDGKWQVKVRRKGQGETMTFALKSDAFAWARKIEGEIERGEWKPRGAADTTTLSAALDRYAKTKTVNKKSKDRETTRIKGRSQTSSATPGGILAFCLTQSSKKTAAGVLKPRLARGLVFRLQAIWSSWRCE
jgi:hypothetical protein